MCCDLQVTFRELEASDTLTDTISEELDQLEHFCPRLDASRVVIARRDRRHPESNRVHISLVLSMSGKVVAVNRDAAGHRTFDDAKQGVHEVFTVARRKVLEEYARVRWGLEPFAAH